MNSKPLSLTHLQNRAIHYLSLRQYEEAFLSLWLITTESPVYSTARAKVPDNSPVFSPQVRRCYEHFHDVEWLDEDQKFRGTPIDHIIKASPLDALWILDRYLLSRQLHERSTAQCVDIKIQRRKMTFWIVRKDPLKALNRRVNSQYIDYMKFFPGHAVIPGNVQGIEVNVVLLESITAQRLDALSSLDDINIYYSHFDDHSTLEYQDNRRGPQGFVISGLTSEAERLAKVLECLEEAKTRQATIIVFPELTITPTIRKAVVQWLAEHDHVEHSISWVVAGSFHETMSLDDKQWINRSYSFGYYGNEIHKHTKFACFGRDDEGYERIKPWKDIWVLETPLGLVATPICLDFCNQNLCAPNANIMNSLLLDLCLVPAMDKSYSAHWRQAENLQRFIGTRSVVAIQHPEDSHLNYSFDSLVGPPCEDE